MEAKDYSRRYYYRCKGEDIEPTPLQAQREKEKRNKWYRIYEVLLDWQDKKYSCDDFAKEAGFESSGRMDTFLSRNGQKLVRKYGGLPMVKTPSGTLKKYMDNEEY